MKLLKKGTKVRFKSIDDNGFPFEATGIIVGYGADIRRLSPMEHGGAPDDVYLVSIISSSPAQRLEIIDGDQILKIIKETE